MGQREEGEMKSAIGRGRSHWITRVRGEKGSEWEVVREIEGERETGGWKERVSGERERDEESDIVSCWSLVTSANKESTLWMCILQLLGSVNVFLVTCQYLISKHIMNQYFLINIINYDTIIKWT